MGPIGLAGETYHPHPSYGYAEIQASGLGKGRFDYFLEGKWIGRKMATINGYPTGRVVLLPASLPLPIRAFILSC